MAEQSLPKTTVPLKATDHIFFSIVPCAARPAERGKKIKKNQPAYFQAIC